MGDGVADPDFPYALDAGDDITHFAGAELLFGSEFQLIVAQFLDRIIATRVHEMDGVSGVQGAFHDAALQNHPSIPVVMGVEDQHFQRRVGVALRTG